MKNDIQNIFMDVESYKLIQDMISLDELVSFICNNVDVSNVQPISIKGYLFEVEYRPDNLNLIFLYTLPEYHTIDPYENEFKKNVYIIKQKIAVKAC